MKNVDKFSMGATAAIITSMGLIAGLTQGVNDKIGIITGLLIVAIADNISDSFSIHIYKESEGASQKEVRSSTIGNFISRLIVALSFIFIILFLPANTAFFVSSVWGLILLAVLSYLIAKKQDDHPLFMVGRHLITALLVIVGSKVLGYFIVNYLSEVIS